MASFSELANAEFDLTHLWKATLKNRESDPDDELLFCSAVEYPTSIVSLKDDILNVGIPDLKDPEVSITIYCPRNKNDYKFNERYFVDWNNNNYDEETGASNIFCNMKLLTIQRLTFGMTIENAEWKPAFCAYVVPVDMPNFVGESTPNFRQMSIKFKKVWGSTINKSNSETQEPIQVDNTVMLA